MNKMIQFENVTKTFGTHKALDNLNFEIRNGEFFVFVGLSGSGKTTTLKTINKLITPSEGRVIINNHDIQSLDSRELRMRIGYVLQQPSLFPNLNIKDNIALIARMKKWDLNRINAEIEKTLPLIGLDKSYLTRMPHELSGGEAQRIGILRALLTNPEILLMDEPFSALDPLIRKDLQDLIEKLHHDVHTTFVFVTHNMREALKLADRIAVFNNGRILQIGTPQDVKNNPANQFVEKLFESEDL